jgi:protein HIRA/HIR1
MKASSSKRIAELMTGNTTIETTSPTSTIDITMTEAEPVKENELTSSSSTVPTVMEQKVSIAKNGKKRIQPVMLSPSASTTTPTPIKPTKMINNTTRISNHVNQIEYDDPPFQGIGSSVTGNKRKLSTEDSQSELTGTKTSRVKPEWVDSAVVPPILQKSLVKLGVPKVKSILSAKARPDDPTIVMECHNAPNSHSK